MEAHMLSVHCNLRLSCHLLWYAYVIALYFLVPLLTVQNYRGRNEYRRARQCRRIRDQWAQTPEAVLLLSKYNESQIEHTPIDMEE